MTRKQLSDAHRKPIEPILPLGEYGPYPERLRQQFEGVIRRFKTGGQWLARAHHDAAGMHRAETATRATESLADREQ